MSRRLIVVDANYGDTAVESAAAAPYGVEIADAGAVRGLAIVDAAGDAEGVLVQYGKIDAAVISGCPAWRVIGRYGVGVDNVDVEAASRAGVAVINVPDYCVEEVASHTAALVLAGWRKLAPAGELVAGGRWADWSELRPVRALSGCTLGLVGIGRIGVEVARLLGPFFGQVVAADPVQAPPPSVQAVSLEELFARADVVSLHCPLTAETERMIDAVALEAMRPGSLLVNVSRGGLVDTAALARALADGTIGGAALDVLPVEPPDPADPLLRAPNLLLTPHTAWYSESSLLSCRELLTRRCCDYLDGKPVPTLVNRDGLMRGARA